MGLVGWYGTRDDAEASATLLDAIDHGVTHLDTAAAYQNGENERFVGAAVASRRDQVFLATKYGITRNAQGHVVPDNKPDSLRKACDTSLANLGTDHIDLYYLHRIDRTVPIEESVGELKSLATAGKIRHLGLSECSVATLQRACAVHPIAAVQSEYSLWSREPEDGMLAACRELGVAFVAYSPLGRGFLAGNFRALEDLPANDVRRMQPRFSGAAGEHNLKVAAAVRDMAQRKGCSPSQLALAWVLAQGEHVFAIPGMKRRDHLHDNLSAVALTLTPAEQTELADRIRSIGTKGERHPAGMMNAIDR